jgi:cell wall-associated NlpC family hydrolase
MAPSIGEFRPRDALTWSELTIVVASLGGVPPVMPPDRPVTVRELDAQLVTLAGLRAEARGIRIAALVTGLSPTPWLGTETVARMLGLRHNHERRQEPLELQPTQPATRAEAAYSIARILRLDDESVLAVRDAVADFSLPALDPWRRAVLSRALRFVGSPYVWGGTSERPQRLSGRLVPGGFDCSGFVWRVYKLEVVAGAPGLSQTLKGRTTYAMSAEVATSARVSLDELQPGDVVFFGSRGPRSKPSEVGHMGIYVGNGWLVHSSRLGTTLAPMTGWYETRFAWGRRPIAEAGLPLVRTGVPGGGRSVKSSA